MAVVESAATYATRVRAFACGATRATLALTREAIRAGRTARDRGLAGLIDGEHTRLLKRFDILHTQTWSGTGGVSLPLRLEMMINATFCIRNVRFVDLQFVVRVKVGSHVTVTYSFSISDIASVSGKNRIVALNLMEISGTAVSFSVSSVSVPCTILRCISLSIGEKSNLMEVSVSVPISISSVSVQYPYRAKWKLIQIFLN